MSEAEQRKSDLSSDYNIIDTPSRPSLGSLPFIVIYTK